jgi:ATP/maltotriose-dependent transcriptional regulator MalT
VLEAEANSLINRGIDFTRAGDSENTDAAFHEVKDIFERDAWFRWRYNIRFEAAKAEHWLRQGELDKAREYVERLKATATEHEVHKYIAVAHELMARVCIASGDLAAAEKEFAAALAELKDYPAPLVAWKVHAGRARLKSQMGDAEAAKEAADRAAEIVNMIAANVADEKLRTTFIKAVSTDYADLNF